MTESTSFCFAAPCNDEPQMPSVGPYTMSRYNGGANSAVDNSEQQGEAEAEGRCSCRSSSMPSFTVVTVRLPVPSGPTVTLREPAWPSPAKLPLSVTSTFTVISAAVCGHEVARARELKLCRNGYLCPRRGTGYEGGT